MKQFLATFKAETSQEYPLASIIFVCILVFLAILTGLGALGGVVLRSVVTSVINQPVSGLLIYIGIFAGAVILSRNADYSTIVRRVTDNLTNAAFAVVAGVIFCGAGYLYSLGIIWVWQELVTKAPLIFVLIALLAIHYMACFLALPAEGDIGSLND